jgi:two-component system response regulator YesN
MEKAEEMLKNSNKSIKDIAVECGFEDQNYFSKVFHKSYKKSPSEYRK